MFDYALFFRIALWSVAIISTILASLTIVLHCYYIFTKRGQLDVALMALRGVQPVFLWRFPLIAAVTWLAIYCFRG